MRILRVFLIAIIAVSASITSARAGVVGECVFDPTAGVITMTPQSSAATFMIWRDGEAIQLNDDTCGGATVTTVDTITVDNSAFADIEVWLGTGAFAPGKTAEEDGSSEIEFVFTQAARGGSVTFRGTDQADHITAGTSASPVQAIGSARTNLLDRVSLNLNADEATPDVDVVFDMPAATVFPSPLWVDLADGKDVYSEAGIGNDASPMWVGSRVVQGGPGDDLLQPAYGDSFADPVFVGGSGVDTLSFAWLPEGCDVFAFDRHGFVSGPGCGSSEFTFGRFERFVGHPGLDRLGGDRGDDTILTRGGDDQLFATGGNDVLIGGVGRDLAIWIETKRVHADLRDGTALVGGTWIQVLDGIEDLYGSPGDDLLMGDARDNELTGNAGDDLLLGRGGIDELYGGDGSDTCDVGPPGTGEFANC